MLNIIFDLLLFFIIRYLKLLLRKFVRGCVCVVIHPVTARRIWTKFWDYPGLTLKQLFMPNKA